MFFTILAYNLKKNMIKYLKKWMIKEGKIGFDFLQKQTNYIFWNFSQKFSYSINLNYNKIYTEKF